MRCIGIVSLAVLLPTMGCSLLFESAETEVEADAALVDGDGDGAIVPPVDARRRLDANTTGSNTLTIVVTSDVGGQVSFSGGPHNGDFCNATRSPCLFSFQTNTAALLVASPNDFLGFLTEGECSADTTVFQRVNIVMSADCTVTAAFGDASPF